MLEGTIHGVEVLMKGNSWGQQLSVDRGTGFIEEFTEPKMHSHQNSDSLCRPQEKGTLAQVPFLMMSPC